MQAQDIAAVVQVLGQFKDAQMPDALKDLQDDQIDVLVNYIYRFVFSNFLEFFFLSERFSICSIQMSSILRIHPSVGLAAYIFMCLHRGLETGQNSVQLFKWFTAVQAKGDAYMGAIVRVLSVRVSACVLPAICLN